MKKTIFDLSYEEGKKLEKEIKKTSYYNQYRMIGYCSITIMVIILVSSFFSEELTAPSENFFSLFTLGFMILIFLLYNFKRFDLMKMYYDEKQREKNEK